MLEMEIFQEICERENGTKICTIILCFSNLTMLLISLVLSSINILWPSQYA